MPQNAIIRADGTGDYTTIIAWEAGEQNSNYGSITVGRVDGFFNQGSSLLAINGAWSNGAKLEPFDASDAFDGTERQLCGLTSSSGTASVRLRCTAPCELSGLEIYNTGTPSSGALNSDLGEPRDVHGCLVKTSGGRTISGFNTGQGISGSVLVNTASITTGIFLATNIIDGCSVFSDSTRSLGEVTILTASNTFSLNSGSGDDFDSTVTQSNNASTDATADTLNNIVIADNFVNSNPVSSGDYRIKSGSDLDTNSIGAFVQSSSGQIDAAVSFDITKPVFISSASATIPALDASVLFDIDKPTFSASASATIPNPQSSVSFDIEKPVFLSNASVTLPNPVSTALFDVNKPVFNSSASASLPNPIASAEFTINEIQFSSTADTTQPGYNSIVDFTVDKPVFTSSASVTLPSPQAVSDFQIDKPIFSAFARASGTGQSIGNVTASFADDSYSSSFKPSEITVNFKS